MTTNPGRTSPSGPKKITRTSATATPGACGANAVTLVTVAAITGLRTTDEVLVSPPTAGLTANLALGKSYCSVAGSVVIPIINPTAAPINQGATTFPVTIIRFDT